MTTPSESVDVLVVGAGPVGLAMAGELERHGVACRIVDQDAGPTDQSRALALHARTLEVFRDMGVIDEVLAEGRPVHGVNAYADHRRILHLSFDLDDVDTAYPYTIVLPQARTERVLERHLEGLGGRVERGVRLTALHGDDEGATATLIGTGGEVREVRAGWVIGCDGAHSAVRHQLGLPFEGAAYEETFLLADVRIDWDRSDDEAHLFAAPEGVVVAFPFPEAGRWRLVDTTGRADGDEPGPAVARLQAFLEAHGPRGSAVSDPTWVSLFRIHRRITPDYRRGRCLVAGDAAHIHSPAGGQGLNTGIQDAHNLAWKLALVQAGAAPDALLDSYSAERQPVAAAVLRGSDLTTRMATLRGPVSEQVRNHLVSFLSGLPFVQRRFSRGLSELGIHYRRSPIVGEDRTSLFQAIWHAEPAGKGAETPGIADYLDFGAAPHAGDRAPDTHLPAPAGPDSGPKRLFDLLPGGTTHALLLFDGPIAGAAGYRTFEAIGRLIRERYARWIRPFVVVHAATPPPELHWDGPLLFDPDGALHHRYGAGSECLYLIRPDRHVAYRSQPVDIAKLSAYLDNLFKF